MQPDEEKWVITLKQAVKRPSVKLICFPYAGGSPDLFRAWSDGLSDHVELLAVRLPGRGKRIKEAHYQDWETLLQDTFDALVHHVAEPHALYGHSFGGRLAYELAQLTTATFPGMTRRLFISGSRSPDQSQRRPYMHEMSENGFIDALRGMGGTPAEILDNTFMMRFFLPAIHAEIRLAELWDDRHGTGVDTPLTAMYGRTDPIDDHASMAGWKGFTRQASELLEMDGGHFFLETHRPQLLDVINSRLQGDV
ncbi:thioesterase II family protein [Streptomyces natalensis]|uniref:Thioesterase n=1 Tax=Streptomyces natalensis ATCC 27448 TaxID=1240678 RepID=A0A0D7CMT6_9ACTN|nr:alpha/beta fold hydrolase [Streptomyces natalensis]KIZ17549.1 thioesterase [Streptomyces natalensis ATCC 27448]